MKKVLVALVIVMGLGFSVAKADEPLKKKSPKVEQRDSRGLMSYPAKEH